ncbi:MAG: cation-translocating P-type ATPase [Lachnospiraceae bacterium]|nr:cation-translocating P-type ATPase [Lachnospiraceae bacterium]
MKEIYQLNKEELLNDKAKNYELQGLTQIQAQKLLVAHGENILTEQHKKSIFSVFISQFKDLLVVILIIAAIISMLSGNMESTLVIFAVIILNAILGTVQYVKAEKSLDSLKELSSPHAKVLRDGNKVEILSRELVPGDILLLEAGDMVSADGRILENFSLQVNESSLTGESTNVDKKEETLTGITALGDRTNMVFSGSLVTYGRAKILVTGTGMQTEMGKIANLMNDTQNRSTPLQISLDRFGQKLALAIMLISVLVFGLRIRQGEPILDSLMFAVALAVAAIPEALSSIVTIVQAMGTRKMAADNAIIKELKAVESLGCVSVICSDKTGTLTQNKMTVCELYLGHQRLFPKDLNLQLRLHRYLLYSAILANDSSIQGDTKIGDPTETCLLTMVHETALSENGVSEEVIRSMMPRLEEIPFDSTRKLMSVKHLIHGVPTILTKGAVDVLLERITRIDTGTIVRDITTEDKEKIIQQNQYFSENGLRVLAFGYKECGENEMLSLESEYDYTFIGLISMIDPPREESAASVAAAIGAGIKPVMITGDHKVTATAIAAQIGIYKEGDLSVTGQELDEMSEDNLYSVLEKISVYARVSPENKIRIVDAWQKKGHIVAMTGDGVNDAPALKKADIGIAMGITGTEVSKDASAMILADDNFATIIKAVLNGRNIYRNILNAIQFLLSGNLAAIITVLYCSVMALTTPFEPVHLLFINLLTDSLPALAIGMEASDPLLLHEKPRNAKAGILTGSFSAKLLLYGVLIAFSTITAYYIGITTDPMTASTMAFVTLALARLFHGFNCRSNLSLVRIGLGSNKWSLAAFGTGVLLLAFVLFVPFMQKLFLVTPLDKSQLFSIAILAALPTLVIQGVRFWQEALASRQ